MNREKVIEDVWFLLKGIAELLGAILTTVMGLLVTAIIIIGGWKLLVWLIK